MSALNFLTGEGILYLPDGVDHSALEALITDYFDRSNSGNGGVSDSSNGKAIE